MSKNSDRRAARAPDPGTGRGQQAEPEISPDQGTVTDPGPTPRRAGHAERGPDDGDQTGWGRSGRVRRPGQPDQASRSDDNDDEYEPL